MTTPRTVVIAGAGIGGLTAALALAHRGLRVSIVEQAERLEEIGAGIQLSPNASRILIDLGLTERLAPYVVVPEEIRVMAARSGRVLARAKLGAAAAQQYGAPYWVVHRGDLQAVLHDACATSPPITLQLGVRVEDFAIHADGVTISGSSKGLRPHESHGAALVGADGLWSALRSRLGHRDQPRFAHHTAWRTLIPAADLPAELRMPAVNLWLGTDAHVVHYPVRGGVLVNVVAIVPDDWNGPGWSAAGDRQELLGHFPAATWHVAARALIGTGERWQKWALHDCAPLKRWGSGPVTLLGDAAHPMLPYLAQGAAMAIEDAAVLAQCLAQSRDDAPAALRRYEDRRHQRTIRTQRAARRTGSVYHMRKMGAFLRTFALLAMGGAGLLRRYNWLYRWKPD